MKLYKNVDGVDVELTAEEEQEHLARQKAFEMDAPIRLKRKLSEELAQFIDKTAQEKEYKDAVSCASYATSTKVIWAAEAQAFIKWRDSVYDYLHNYLIIEINPSLDDFMKNLPKMIWPL